MSKFIFNGPVFIGRECESIFKDANVQFNTTNDAQEANENDNHNDAQRANENANEKQGADENELPDELQTPEAKECLDKLVEAGYLTNTMMPRKSWAITAIMVKELGEYLGLRNHFKVFGELFRHYTLANNYQSALNSNKSATDQATEIRRIITHSKQPHQPS